MSAYDLGIDVGGTFVDFVLAPTGGGLRTHKELGTPDDLSEAVIRGLASLARQEGLEPHAFLGRVRAIVHGTTVSTNALITGGGVPTGLLTTRGVRDALEMRRGVKEEVYNLKYRAPTPLVPRYWRLPIPERLDYAGNVLSPLDHEAVRAAARKLRAEGVEAVAICFLHAYANPEHERAAAQLLAEEWPDVYCTASADLVPQLGFYERTSSTVLNAYTGPLLRRYLTRIVARLSEGGFSGVLLVVSSAGGVMAPDVAIRQSASTIGSGPAAGPIAAARFALAQGYADCVVTDMGGTSFDTALVRDGQPIVVHGGTIDRRAIGLPMVSVHSIGAGGGSIAWIDAGGVLRVGPRSAGARPGPACYDGGGTQPTCTDADLVLGYLNPDYFLGGRIRLNRQAAETAIRTQLGPLGHDPVGAAAGIYDVVNTSMAAAMRTVTLERGLDIRDLPMVVAGGAGPVHAAAIAAELDIPVVLVPRTSSTFCALGTLFLDFRHEYARSCFGPLEGLDVARARDLCDEMARQARQTLAAEQVPADRVVLDFSADIRYEGQFRDTTVPLMSDELETGDLTALIDRFHARHDELYGYAAPELRVQLVNVRLSAYGITDKPTLPPQPAACGSSEDARRGQREAYLPANGTLASLPVYDGDRLGFGHHLAAPALIDLPNTTVVVLPPYDVLVDRWGTFTLYRPDQADAVRKRVLDGDQPE